MKARINLVVEVEGSLEDIEWLADQLHSHVLDALWDWEAEEEVAAKIDAGLSILSVDHTTTL